MTAASPRSRTRDTIFALASGVGKAAIAVIRLSGPAAPQALEALTGSSAHDARTARLRAIRDPQTGEILDRAIVLWFPAPNSFTGEDMAELQVTGGPSVVRGVSSCLARQPGFRPADPGEFAWRAFENGKLDLSEVEGLADLVDAETEAQRRQAANLAGGALRRQAAEIRELVLRAMSLIESQIDFSDIEEVDADALMAAENSVDQALERVQRILSEGRRGERLREGLHIVIAGPPNAGKSTLMNALARRDVSIVSSAPGTTRDVIEVSMDLEGYPVTLIDTAGIRETNDPIETLGIERALRRAADADLTLWLSPHGQPSSTPQAEQGGPIWRVETKCDASDIDGADATGEESHLRISAQSGFGLDKLLDELAKFASEQIGGAGTALMTTERHRIAFEDAAAALRRVCKVDEDHIELIAEDLRLAARAMDRVSGRIDVEDVLGDIFSRLCVGK